MGQESAVIGNLHPCPVTRHEWLVPKKKEQFWNHDLLDRLKYFPKVKKEARIQNSSQSQVTLVIPGNKPLCVGIRKTAPGKRGRGGVGGRPPDARPSIFCGFKSTFLSFSRRQAPYNCNYLNPGIHKVKWVSVIHWKNKELRWSFLNQMGLAGLEINTFVSLCTEKSHPFNFYLKTIKLKIEWMPPTYTFLRNEKINIDVHGYSKWLFQIINIENT